MTNASWAKASWAAAMGRADASKGIPPVVQRNVYGGLQWEGPDLPNILGVHADKWGHAYARAYRKERNAGRHRRLHRRGRYSRTAGARSNPIDRWYSDDWAARARQIAHYASGREDVLRRELRAAGIVALRERPGPNRPELAQITVRLPDGRIGYFAPGGPRDLPEYQFVEGSRPGDSELPGYDPTRPGGAANPIGEWGWVALIGAGTVAAMWLLAQSKPQTAPQPDVAAFIA